MTNLVRLTCNKLMFRLGYIPKPQFPQAGVGSGYMFYRVLGPHRLRLLISTRHSSVGAGSGISCGGWFELASLLGTPDGTTITDQESAEREGWEEIPGLLNVLPSAVLKDNSQMIYGGAVHRPNDRYGNTFHKPTFLAMAVTEAEEVALCKLPKSNETAAPLRTVDITWTVDTPTADDLVGLPDDFHHGHEREAYAQLAQLAHDGRLWTQRKAA